MKFEEALKLLKEGHKIRRIDWSEFCYIELLNIIDRLEIQFLYEDEIEELCYGCENILDSEDLLADDWVVVE